jgi:hypothetical protein
MAALYRDMRIVSKEPEGGLWFKHESPFDMDLICPVSYKLLAERKGELFSTMRRMYDQTYRAKLPHHQDYSYLHATVVGANLMEDPSLYPGFTYFFQLPTVKVEQALFTIIDGGFKMEPTLGQEGLTQALYLWNYLAYPSLDENAERLSKPTTIGHTLVCPRVEVLLPFAVEPSLVFPDLENR